MSTLVKGTFGYGFAAAGCQNVTVQGNVVLPPVQFEGSNDWNTDCPGAAPFVKWNDSALATGSFQSEFIDTHVRWLISIQPGLGQQKRFFPGGLSLAPKQQLNLKEAVVELQANGNLRFMRQGTLLWESCSAYEHVNDARLEFTEKSGLQIMDGQNRPLWSPQAYIPKFRSPVRQVNYLKASSVVLKESAPYVSITDDTGSLVFASSYVFPIDWTLFDGQYVAIPAFQSSKLRQAAPPVTWLYLEPGTSQLVLHTSSTPYRVEKGQEIWRSRNHRMPPKDEKPEGHYTKLTLQSYVFRLASPLELSRSTGMEIWLSTEMTTLAGHQERVVCGKCFYSVHMKKGEPE